jgi:hypothetical protein
MAVVMVTAGTSRQGAAQEPPQTLTLGEALEIAVMNNPTYLSQTNDQEPADWAVRESYAQFLPQLNVGGGVQYTGAGVQTFGVFTSGDIGAGSTDYYFSDYFAQLNWTLSGQTLFQPGSAKADQKAVGARIRAARFDLESLVTLQYTGALLAREAVDVADQQLERALENYEIVQARVDAGAAVSTDAKSAEVTWGRAKVTVLEAENLFRASKNQLMETIGIPMREDIALEGEFDAFELDLSREDLIVMALETHPSLQSQKPVFPNGLRASAVVRIHPSDRQRAVPAGSGPGRCQRADRELRAAQRHFQRLVLAARGLPAELRGIRADAPGRSGDPEQQPGVPVQLHDPAGQRLAPGEPAGVQRVQPPASGRAGRRGAE